MRHGTRRFLSAALSVLMISCMIPSAATGTAASPSQAPSAVTQQQYDSYAMDNIQDGVILHCFDGSFNNTKGSMAVVNNVGDTDEPYITREKLYFVPNTNWKNDNARFAMYLFKGSDNQWVSMTDADGDGTYEADVPNGNWTNVIFCRMNPATTENNWNSGVKWNQTNDLFPDDNTDRYAIAEGVWDEGEDTAPGTWDNFAGECQHDYSEPVWTWEPDLSTATITYSCIHCGNTVELTDDSPEISYVSNVRIHTATIENFADTYTTTIYEPMVTHEYISGATEYFLQNPQVVADIYECVMGQPDYSVNEVNISSFRVPVEYFNYLHVALATCFPEYCFSLSGGKQTSDGYIKSFTGEYTMTKQEADTKLAAFYEKADEYLALLTPDMDDLTKAIVLHDQLVLDHYYQVESDTEYSSNFTFMLDGWGRCENYAEIYAFLLARAGIKCEIVNSKEMVHEWLMICLDGKYYHIDITWDDPIFSNGTITYERPNKVSHKYFLLSDTKLQDSNYATAHTGYTAVNAAQSDYDGYDNIHTNSDPILYNDGSLYSLFTESTTVAGYGSNLFEKAVLATYDPSDDTYSSVGEVNEQWHTSTGSVYLANNSSIAQHEGVFYINGEHNVYAYDPSLGTSFEDQKQTPYLTYTDAQLYGIFTKDGALYGIVGTDPVNTTHVLLKTFEVTPEFTVTWENWDGTVLETDTDVPYNSDPSYDSAEPTRASTAQYDYTFSGWTPEISAVTGDVTYTAVFTEETRKYTITWLMDDGSTIDTTSVEYGTLPTHDDPIKASDKRYTYTFTGWTPAVAEVTGEATYTAQFSATEITYYLVGTMNNWTLDEDYAFEFNSEAGSANEYMLKNVSLDAGDEFKAKSSNNLWFPDGGTSNIVIESDGVYDIYLRPGYNGGNTWTYGLFYVKNVTPCTVKFVSEGEELQTSTLLYGETPEYTGDDPEKEEDFYYTYNFSGWDPEIDAVTGDITYTAQFTATEKTVTITYVDFNGVETVNTVGMASFSTETFTLKSPYLDGYTLNGWTVNGNAYTDKNNALAEIASLVAAGTPVEITPIYTNKDETHTVHVLGGGKLSNGPTFGTFKPAKQLFVNAPETDADGKVFDRWEISLDEQYTWFTVGFDNTYAFRMPLKDVYLRAVYVNSEADKTERKGIAYIENYYKSDEGAISFVAVLTTPKELTMVRGGIVACKLSDLDETHDAPTIDYARFKRFTETEEIGCSSLKYTWTKSNIKDGDTWCVCAYLVFLDGYGAEHEVYSDMVWASLDDFV